MSPLGPAAIPLPAVALPLSERQCGLFLWRGGAMKGEHCRDCIHWLAHHDATPRRCRNQWSGAFFMATRAARFGAAERLGLRLDPTTGGAEAKRYLTRLGLDLFNGANADGIYPGLFALCPFLEEVTA